MTYAYLYRYWSSNPHPDSMKFVKFIILCELHIAFDISILACYLPIRLEHILKGNGVLTSCCATLIVSFLKKEIYMVSNSRVNKRTILAD